MKSKHKILLLLFFLLFGFNGCKLLPDWWTLTFPAKENQPQPVIQSHPDTPIYENFPCVNPNQPFQTARVVKVIDGDSIVIKMNSSLFEVRYIGIDTPEYQGNERMAAIEATRANENLLFGKEVFLFKDVSETDKFGRLLRYVFTNDVFINLELVKNGYAESKTYPPDTACQDIFVHLRGKNGGDESNTK